MKKFFATLSLVLAVAAVAWAQTPEEIISQMENVMRQHEAEGVVMTMDMKIPILGTFSTHVWTLGDRTRAEMEVVGEKVVTISDGTTSWTYNGKNNEITIDAAKASPSDGNPGMFKDVTEGYDVSLKKETDKAWYFSCKKSRTNTKKDDPKTMEIVVEKGSYMPLSLSARLSGVTMTMRGISFGFNEDLLVFDQDQYPGATVVDKR